jgi:tripartite-type tricarboxylate transporter receptor subunit TctC
MTGVGNPLHLTMEMFKTMAGIDIQPVPYKGTSTIFPTVCDCKALHESLAMTRLRAIL